MNPDFEKLSDDNILYAPDSFRQGEYKATEEAIKKGNDGFEKAELARQALLEKYKELGKLTKAGNTDLETFTPVEQHRGEETYTEYPYVEENKEVSYKRK